MKVRSPLEMTLNEIREGLFHFIAGDPGSPTEGQFWYNSVSRLLKYRNNTRTITVDDQYVTSIGVTEPLTSTGGLTPTLDITNASSGVDGAMSGADKTKLDAATASPTVSTLVLRDANGRFQAVAPSADSDVANKSYVDNVAQGLDVKASVRLATAAALPAYTRTANVITATANGALTVDGVAVAINDRILVKDGASGADNGIYIVTNAGAAGAAYVLTRATDADTSAEVTAGMFTFVEEGTVNADSGWLLTTNNPITLNTTALVFAQFNGGGTITAGDGLTKSGSVISAVAGTGITVNGSGIHVTSPKLAYDADIGDGSTLALVVTHNLGTRNLIAQVHRSTTPWDVILVDIEFTSTNTVTVRFAGTAPTTNEFHITIRG